MTMQPWLVQPLRRFAGTLAMLIAAEATVQEILHVSPELPPATVDRVQVMTMEGSHAITDRRTVARIVTLVRERARPSTRIPETVCFLGTPRADFYQGAERRGEMMLGVRVIVVPAGHERVTMVLRERDAAELYRLLAIPRPEVTP